MHFILTYPLSLASLPALSISFKNSLRTIGSLTKSFNPFSSPNETIFPVNALAQGTKVSGSGTTIATR